MLTVRNRLAITRKCIQALVKHSTIPHQIYVYNNLTSYRIDDHFAYFFKLYQKGIITQVTFNTKDSTFDAFSKAVSCNQFGNLHEIDPKKDRCQFLLFLDNDVIVTPGWDKIVAQAWVEVNKLNLKDVKVIAQLPGGIKNKVPYEKPIAGLNAKIGKLGGSGFWSVRPNFFTDVGYLDLQRLVGQNKKHDQDYWLLMERKTNGKPYIMGLETKLGIHCGAVAGSVCNSLTRHRNDPKVMEKIKFEDAEKEIESQKFEDFYTSIINKIGVAGW